MRLELIEFEQVTVVIVSTYMLTIVVRVTEKWPSDRDTCHGRTRQTGLADYVTWRVRRGGIGVNSIGAIV